MLQETNSEICILNLNCLNLKTQLDKLTIFLADTDSHSKISCITLQDTCFDKHTDLAFHSIPGYTTTPAACGGTGSSVKKDLKIGVAPFLP